MVPDATLAVRKRPQERIPEALVIAVHRAQHVRPGRGEDKHTGPRRCLPPLCRPQDSHIRPDAEKRRHCAIICHRLPEGVDDGAPLLSTTSLVSELIGSSILPNARREERSYFFAQSVPERSSVVVLYCVILCR